MEQQLGLRELVEGLTRMAYGSIAREVKFSKHIRMTQMYDAPFASEVLSNDGNEAFQTS